MIPRSIWVFILTNPLVPTARQYEPAVSLSPVISAIRLVCETTYSIADESVPALWALLRLVLRLMEDI